MIEQASLFDALDVQPRARRTDPDTSQIAAIEADHAAAQREQIHRFLKANGPATADAIDEALGLRLTSAGRRLPELRELGLARMREDRGMTRSGRPARLWEAAA